MNTASQEKWVGKIFLGKWCDADGGTVPIYDPATGSQLAELGAGQASDIQKAVERATDAQRAWAEAPFDRRASVLYEAARLLKARTQRYVDWNVHECGSIVPKALTETNMAYDQLMMAASLPMQPDGLLFPSSMPGRINMWRRVPIGIVGIITPWNFPLLLAVRSLAPALALGNAVILKPDPQSAVTGGALVAELFADAGLPEGVLHVVPGGPETGEALVRHPDVRMISFTGSTVVGRRIGEACGRMLKKASLELGGNNPMIVLADADLDRVVSSAAWGSFLHQGQICLQAGRHLVHRSLAQDYAAKLAERARRLVVGNPAIGEVHVGPLINDRQAERVERIVRASVDAGAKVVVGGKRNDRFFEPTVLTNVTPSMPVFREEIFGPVAPITTFDTLEEVIELVHASDYGLSAAIHSRSTAAALNLASNLRTGMVHINDQTVNYEYQVPFGGMGSSGNGSRFGGPASVEAFTQSQLVSSMDTPIEYPF